MTRALTLVALIAACEAGPRAEVDAPTPDAGPIDEEPFVPTPPAEPAPPAMPVFTPCPEGWREVTADGLVTCDPWPESGYQSDCAIDEAHFPGTPGCARIGTECPTGDFAEDIPADASVVYVRAGAPEGGDGTRERPFGTIGAALAVAPDGAVVALSKGTFDESIFVEQAVTLWGACVAETIVARSVPDDVTPTIALGFRGGMALRNLQVSGVRRGILVLGNVEPVRIDDVLVRGTSEIGIFVWGGGDVLASGLVIRDVQARSDGEGGFGIEVYTGGRLDLTRAAVERCRSVGIFVAGSTVVASDLVVRETIGNPDPARGDPGVGTAVTDGGRLELTRSVFEANGEGLGGLDVGSTVVATDVVVRDAVGDEPLGRGLEFNFGLHADLSRVLVETVGGLGVFTSSGSSIDATDLVVRDAGSTGFLVQYAVGRLERAAILRTRHAGVVAFLESDLEAIDLSIEESSSDGPLGRGIGLGVYFGSRVSLTRARLERNQEAGIHVYTEEGGLAPELRATDLVVRDTRSGPDGTFGNGLSAVRSQIQLARAVLSGNHNFGIQVNGGDLVLEDIVVEGTLEEEVAVEGADGNGIHIVEGGTVDVTRFRISGNARVGVQLDQGGTIDLHDGEISENAVGANVETDPFDFRRLQDRVLYSDNGVNLDTADLPLPNAIGGVEEEL